MVKRNVQGALLLAACSAIPSVQAQAGQRAAWIDGSAASVGAVRVIRAGKAHVHDVKAGLQPCDQLQLVDTRQVVRVVLADGGRMRLDASRPQATVPCSSRGVGETLGRLIAAWSSQSDSRSMATVAMSRGAQPLGVPVLFSSGGAVLAATGQLSLSWRGGTGPYQLVLQDAAGASVATRSAIGGYSATLSLPRVAPGRYALVVTDATGATLAEENVQLVPATAVPPMPDALRQAQLHPVARELFYADYLVAHEDGRFALQAMQQVAAIAPQTAETRAWLEQWGSAP